MREGGRESTEESKWSTAQMGGAARDTLQRPKEARKR